MNGLRSGLAACWLTASCTPARLCLQPAATVPGTTTQQAQAYSTSAQPVVVQPVPGYAASPQAGAVTPIVVPVPAPSTAKEKLDVQNAALANKAADLRLQQSQKVNQVLDSGKQALQKWGIIPQQEVGKVDMFMKTVCT